MTITTYTDREIALRQQLAAALQLAQLNGEIAAELKADKLALEASIADSREQEPVAYRVWRSGDDYELFFNKHSARIRGSSYLPIHEVQNLYAAPVIAPDVLKDAERYRWLISDNSDADIQEPKQSLLVHAVWEKVLDCGGNYAKDEIDTAIDAAIGGANA